MSGEPGAGAGLSPPPAGAASGSGAGSSSPPDPLVGVLPTVLESAVSLLFVPASKKEEATEYGSGFVILSHNNYSYVFTRYFFKDEHHVNAGTIYVQFYESCSITEANIICNNSEFMVLTVEDKENKGKPITLAQERATYEKCCTLGTLSGTKMHASAKVPLEHFMGAIGAYFGQLITPDCRASSHKRRSAIQTVEGSQSYFMVTCPYKDKMVDLDNIDKPGHTCTRIIGAAVFRSTGDIIGAISSPTTYPDVKYGLHVEEMIGLIGNMCLPSSGKENEEEFKMLDWEDKLKRVHEIFLQRRPPRPRRHVRARVAPWLGH